MKPWDEYKNKLPYPTMPKQAVCKECGCTKHKTYDAGELADYDTARAAYGREEGRLTEMFRQDLFTDLGITDHPKRDVLWAKAWEMGHSSGLHDVHHYASELVELLAGC